MKTIISFLFASLLVLGCASKPTWNNMSEESISAWKASSVNAAVANKLTKHGITPEQYKLWKDLAIENVDTIIAWSGNKFTAESAKSWIDSGFSLNEAIANRAKGLSPVEPDLQ